MLSDKQTRMKYNVSFKIMTEFWTHNFAYKKQIVCANENTILKTDEHRLLFTHWFISISSDSIETVASKHMRKVEL